VTVRSGALRRRRKPSLVTRLRIMWVFIVILVSTTAYVTYVLVTLPAFTAHSIDVDIDGIAVSKDEVLAAAAIDRHANIWLLDTHAIERRIEAIPYVDVAAVSRIPPGAIALHVTERVPIACVRAAGEVSSIDRDRRVLQAGCARPAAITIKLDGGPLGRPGSFVGRPELIKLLADAHALGDANLALRSLYDDRYGELVAIDARGIELLFGNDADLPAKAQLVAPVLAATHAGRRVWAIDLRAPATPTVEFR
jgi:hypothetical protein